MAPCRCGPPPPPPTHTRPHPPPPPLLSCRPAERQAGRHGPPWACPLYPSLPSTSALHLILISTFILVCAAPPGARCRWTHVTYQLTSKGLPASYRPASCAEGGAYAVSAAGAAASYCATLTASNSSPAGRWQGRVQRARRGGLAYALQRIAKPAGSRALHMAAAHQQVAAPSYPHSTRGCSHQGQHAVLLLLLCCYTVLL